MEGKVTIDLKDFDRLREAKEQADEVIKNTEAATAVYDMFFNHLNEKVPIQQIIDGFNRSPDSGDRELVLVGGRVRAKLK